MSGLNPVILLIRGEGWDVIVRVGTLQIYYMTITLYFIGTLQIYNMTITLCFIGTLQIYYMTITLYFIGTLHH